MSADWSWLIDAEFQNDTVRLSYFDSQGHLTTNNQPFEPYFYVESGTSDLAVQKKDLFMGKTRQVIKVPWNSQQKKAHRWEHKIDPAMSFIYDNHLRFGTLYHKSGIPINSEQWMAPHLYQKFCYQFQNIKETDPLKFEFLEDFFKYIMQPIPEIDLLNRTLRARYNDNEIYRGFMLSRIGNLPLKKAMTSRRVSEWIKSMLYSVYRHHNILIPNDDELTKGEKVHAVEGALTLSPQEGVYYQMHVLDFESLYPSCIDHYNLSYETVDVKNPCQKSTPVPTTTHKICMDQRGIFSALIGALKELRVHWYKPLSKNEKLAAIAQKRADTMSRLLKIFMNSCYGVTIRIPGLACPPLAESITAYGRWALQQTEKLACSKGMNPVYGDTDSLFIADPKEGMINWLTNKTKTDLGLDLAVDVKYTICVLSSAKKAYFGIFSNGQPDLKGVTLGKSSTPPLFRKIFLDALIHLKDVDNQTKLEKAQPKITELLKQHIKKIRNGNFSIPDLEYRVKLWKTKATTESSSSLPQPYQAKAQLEKAGITIHRKQDIGFVKVKSFRFGKKKFSVKPTDFVKAHEIDIPDYIRKLELAFQQVLKPLNIPFPKTETLSLERFMA